MHGSLQKLEFSYAGILYLGTAGASHLLAARAAFSRGSRHGLCALCSREGCREAAQPQGCGQGRECEDCTVGAAHGSGSPEQWAGSAEEPRWARRCWHLSHGGRAAAGPAVEILLSADNPDLCAWGSLADAVVLL